jgi:hypothetical protein
VRTWGAVIAATLVMVLLGLGGFLWISRDADVGTGSASEAATRTEPTGPRLTELRAIESSLGSGKLRQIRRTFAIPADVTLAPGFVRAVKSWRSVELVPDSYRGVDASTGVIEAVLRTTDGTTSRWRLRLDRVDGEWLVSSTMPVR